MRSHIKEMARHLQKKPEVLELTETILALAEGGQVEELLAALNIPLRLILAVRSNIVETGKHAVLTDALILGARSPKPRVRYHAAQAMDHLADARCVEPLRRLLDDPVPRVRAAALHALSCDECKAAPLPR